MRTKYFFVIVVVLGMVAVVFQLSHIAKQVVELNGAKTALLHNMQTLSNRVDEAWAEQWRNVAQDYLEDYDRGRVDAEFQSARTNYHENAGDRYHKAAREAIFAVMAANGKKETWKDDVRVKTLDEIQTIRVSMYTLRFEADVAKNQDELAGVLEKFDQKREALEKLLQKIGRVDAS